MRPETRKKLNEFFARIARLNGVEDATKTFAVEPSVQQTLETKMQESSEFLNRINIIGVNEQEGEKLGLGVNGPIASRTDTNTKDRQTRDVSTLTPNRYKCIQTNSDTHIRYALLDAWAKFQDFQIRLRDAILKRQALDRMMIGFNGTRAAAETDLDANPLLQDVNIGWLEQYRLNAEERVISEGGNAGEISIGATGDYKNLDALVYDMIHSLIAPWFRNDPNLVVMVGSGLVDEKYFPIINRTWDPTEMLAADIIISQKQLGGKPAVMVPFFPENGILVTTYDNLSIYYQNQARRRYLLDNPKRDRIENYESSNDAYVVEDYDRGAFAENIKVQS